MDLPSLLNTKGSAASVEPGPHQHMGERAPKFSRSEPHRLHLTTNLSTNTMSGTPGGLDSSGGGNSAVSSGSAYDSPGGLQPFGLMPNPYPTPTTSYDTEYSSIADEGRPRAPASATSDSAPPLKAFACGTCGKGFARRSDLARHERIHTGVRPHVCEYPGCKKQFIQRSALTVHARVHTGEKPHMCEHCTKPFSDSSSLARHRRIHSGKRPYKCPYADCQKTFTRRTTLTRHMSHHTDTVEEAAAATAAALAQRPAPRPRSDGEYSDHSARSTPSPSDGRHHRGLSTSPGSDLPHHMPLLPRASADYAFLAGGRTLPPHIRSDLQPQHSPRSSTGSSSPASAGGFASSHRPSLTSHPAMYGPPPILEPPTHHDSRSSGSGGGSPHPGLTGSPHPGLNGSPHPGLGSGVSPHPGLTGSPHPGGSPHLGSVGWPSPAPLVGSPVHHPDWYDFGGHGSSHWAYPGGGPRRSTEPEAYGKRMLGSEVWSGGL